MTEVLLLRLEAPLMSFGGPAVDNHRFTMLFPGRALLTGLLANALGLGHQEFDRLDALQHRIRYAVRRDREGTPLVDYQTVGLGEAHVPNAGWTTWGRIESRGGANAQETHIRYRHYLADAVYTVALTLTPEAEEPTLDALEHALRAPARPLYIGRKCCIPTSSLLLGRSAATTLAQAVQRADLPKRLGRDSDLLAWWPHDEIEPPGKQILAVTDDLDWANQIHVGRRFMRQDTWKFEEVGHER